MAKYATINVTTDAKEALHKQCQDIIRLTSQNKEIGPSEAIIIMRQEVERLRTENVRLNELLTGFCISARKAALKAET